MGGRLPAIFGPCGLCTFLSIMDVLRTRLNRTTDKAKVNCGAGPDPSMHVLSTPLETNQSPFSEVVFGKNVDSTHIC
ncbi:hypothetical protein JOB18_020897 [Solea senegalensis]|nr:hypothetical protein JOB18_020897 [Solea senegalensis]